MKKQEADSKSDIDVTQVARIKPEQYVVDIMVDHAPWRLLLPTMNLQCLMASLSVLAAVHYPRVEGWNIYVAEGEEKGRLLLSVNTIDFIAQITKATPLKNDPGNTSKSRLIPLATPTSEAFQQMIEKSKKDGRIPK